jgi:hypothetical protein
VIWVGAAWGLWFLPFVVGVAAGLACAGRSRKKAALALACLGALAGWSLPLLAMSAAGLPVAGTARVVAAEAGLPPYALVTLAATVLVALAQAALGVWAGGSAARLVSPGIGRRGGSRRHSPAR